MAGNRLAVLLGGRIAGWLERPQYGFDPSFQYSDEYIDDGEVALSARMPIQEPPFPAERVMPYLLGLIPESTEARQRWANQLDVSPDDAFDMLAAMGWDCPGAVQFCEPERLNELAQRSLEYAQTDDKAIGSRLRAFEDTEASWTMPEEHWSLGGQQEKFALARISGQWFEAHGAAATTHIFKPGIKRLKFQALVEHLTMRAASLAGVTVAPSEYRQFDGQWAIVIERFDRALDLGDEIRRLHQEDFCQATGRTPDRKYEERRGPTLRDMNNVIQRESISLKDDREALADFLAINVVAGAPDGHSKNIALLRGNHGSTIAPLFDLATGLAYDQDKVDRKIALSVGGERQVSRIYRKQWQRTAEVIGINSDELIARVGQLASDFPPAFEDAINEVSDAPGAAEVAERAIHRLTEHCALILGRLD